MEKKKEKKKKEEKIPHMCESIGHWPLPKRRKFFIILVFLLWLAKVGKDT